MTIIAQSPHSFNTNLKNYNNIVTHFCFKTFKLQLDFLLHSYTPR